MLAVNGYSNGNNIILDQNINLTIGQQILVTIIDNSMQPQKKVDLSSYMGRGKKLIDSDAQEAVRGLRENDRL